MRFLKKFLIFSKVSFILFLPRIINAAEDEKEPSPGTLGVLERVGIKAEFKTETGVIEIISLIINGFLGILGVVFLVLLIYGGYIWMIGRENEDEIKKAKGIIRNAVIGIIIIVLAYTISKFVINVLSKAF